MNRRERLLLLAFFVLVLVGLGQAALTPAVVGGVAGAVVGVGAAGRLQRISRRMDDTLGADEPASTGFVLRRPLTRAALQLALLAGLLGTTVFVPFVGDELFAASAAFVTAVPAAVTALRLRR